MARLFQALVVLGGSLAGCGGRTGSDVGRTNNEGADSHNETVATDEDVGADQTAVEPTEDTSDSSSQIISAPTTATLDTDSTTADAPSDDGIIMLDPPPKAPSLPEDCAPEAWQCDAFRSCTRGDGPSCGDAWNGEIESCSIELAGVSCVCGEAGVPKACDDGEIRTCLHSERVAPDGRTEMLHFWCECLPAQETCETVCNEHSSGIGGVHRACVETPGLVLCGGCIWAGILR